MEPGTPGLNLVSAIYKVGVLCQVPFPICASVSSVTRRESSPSSPCPPPPLQVVVRIRCNVYKVSGMLSESSCYC